MMGAESALITEESEMFHHLQTLAKECDSWWACLGNVASVVSTPLWRIVTAPKEYELRKLQYAIVSVGPRFGDLQALRAVHSTGALRVVTASEGVFEPNVYSFTSGDKYAAIVISGVDAPAVFGDGFALAVMTQCSVDHPFALATEAFLRRCKRAARLMTLPEIESLERRFGFLEQPERSEPSSRFPSLDEKECDSGKVTPDARGAARLVSTDEQRTPDETITETPSGLVFVSGKRGIHALTLDRSDLQWVFETESTVTSNCVVEDGSLFFGCYDGRLYSVDVKTGVVNWFHETSEKTWAGLAVSRLVLCYSGSDNCLHAIDVARGTEIWKFPTSSRLLSAPTIDQWVVYVGGSDGKVYSVDIETGEGQCIFDKRDWRPAAIAVVSEEGPYWSASQLAQMLTDRLGAKASNDLRSQMGIQTQTGKISGQMVTTLLEEMGLHRKDSETGERRLSEKGNRLGRRTLLLKPDGTSAAYLRWKESVLEILNAHVQCRYA